MREHTKTYSNLLYEDAIEGKTKRLRELIKKDVVIDLFKENNDLYTMQLVIDNEIVYNVCDTIDCCYRLIDGYYRAIYDSKKYKLF